MKLMWLTDLHLNFLSKTDNDRFLRRIAEVASDAVVITGDIAEAPTVTKFLANIAIAMKRPVYFVLGNHDFYLGSIEVVRRQVDDLSTGFSDLTWLPKPGVVPLTSNTCLVGHDGWGDGRCGDYANSDVMLSDWSLIHELSRSGRSERLTILNELGDEAAEHFRSVLPAALEQFQHVVVATHVPPFKEACWHEGQISDENWLPHFTCKAVGTVLAEVMANHVHRRMTVLCGHTHSPGEAQVLPNLQVLTGRAVYGAPDLQRVIELE